MMGTKLHEILAVEGDLQNAYKAILDETVATFTKKTQLFVGYHRWLKNFDENAPESPQEHHNMETTVHDKLRYMEGHVVRYLDVVLEKERTNQEAKGDIVVDGVTLAERVPATFLLGLEDKLRKLRGVYATIPTLPAGLSWIKAPQKGAHVYVTEHLEEKTKTSKTFQHTVLVSATKEHPAQIEKWQEDVPVGVYQRETWTGMISPAEKSTLLGRIDTLLRAVKKARQRANSTEVVKSNIGLQLFNFIHSDE